MLPAAESSGSRAATEIAAVTSEIVAIDERSATGDVGVVVKDDRMVMPVTSPAMPSPAKAAEEADSKTCAEFNRRAADENSWHRIPSGPHRQGRTVHEPRIVCGHINDVWIGWFNDDRLSLRRYRLLRRALQISRLLRTSPHNLYGIHHGLLLIYIGISQRRGPGKILVQVGKHGRKLRERLNTGIPALLIYLFT